MIRDCKQKERDGYSSVLGLVGRCFQPKKKKKKEDNNAHPIRPWR